MIDDDSMTKMSTLLVIDINSCHAAKKTHGIKLNPLFGSVILALNDS